MKINYILYIGMLLQILIIKNLHAQIVFQKYYDINGSDYFRSANEISNNDILITGHNIGSFTNTRGLIIKASQEGIPYWAKYILDGYWGRNNYAIKGEDCGYFVFGSKSDSIKKSGIVVYKFGGNDDLEWSKSYGNFYHCWFKGIDYSNNSNGREFNRIVMTGHNDYASKDTSILVYMNYQGDTIWTKNITVSEGITTVNEIKLCQDNGVIIVGNTTSFGAGNHDFFAMKFNENGLLEWQKTYGSSTVDIGESIIRTNNEAFIMCGRTLFEGNNNILVIKISITGEVIWAYKYTVENTNNEGFKIVKTTNNNYLISSWHKPRILKINDEGEVLWSRNYGEQNGNDFIFNINKTNDGFLIAGSTSNYSNSSSSNGYLIKTNKEGYSGCNQEIVDVEIEEFTPITNNSNFKVLSGIKIFENSPDILETEIEENILCLEQLTNTNKLSKRSNGLKVLPNPAVNSISILIAEKSNLESDNFIFTDIVGRIILTTKEQNNIDISNFPKGVYLVNVCLENQIVAVKKFIKY